MDGAAQRDALVRGLARSCDLAAAQKQPNAGRGNASHGGRHRSERLDRRELVHLKLVAAAVWQYKREGHTAAALPVVSLGGSSVLVCCGLGVEHDNKKSVIFPCSP